MSVTKDQAEIALKKFMHRLEESVLRRLDTADSAQNLVAAAALLEGGAELEAAYTAPDANSADLTLLHGTKMLDAANFASFRNRDIHAPKTLTNWVGSVEYEIGGDESWPDIELKPSLLKSLSETVAKVKANGGKLRVVGARHSFSNVLEADKKTLVLYSQNVWRTGNAILPLSSHEPISHVDGSIWVRLDACATVTDAAASLWSKKLAFGNQGGFSGQSLAGAVTCSTHGAGTTYAPLSSFVDAFDFMGEDGKVTRVQSEGLHWLDDAAFRGAYGEYAGKLVRNDEALRAARVSFGQFGMLLSVVMRVERAYKLSEVRTVTSWKELKATGNLATLAARHKHCEIWVNPNGANCDDRTCVVVERNAVDAETDDESAGWVDPVVTAWHASNLTFGNFQDLVADLAYGAFHDCVGPRLDLELRGLASPVTTTGTPAARIARPDFIFNVGKANEVNAVCAEHFFPADQAERAVEEFMTLIQDNYARTKVPHPGWLSVRFIAPTDSFMSMTQGRTTWCSIELPMITGSSDRAKGWYVPKVKKALASYQQKCLDLGGRFHWAQHWVLSKGDLATYVGREYPDCSKWSSWQKQIGGSLFDNQFLP